MGQMGEIDSDETRRQQRQLEASSQGSEDRAGDGEETPERWLCQ